MNRREFLSGAGGLGIVSLSACSPSALAELDLPEPVQVDRPPWPVAAGMTGLASFLARVVILGRRDYPVDAADTLSAVSPTDLAVAWGIAAKTDTRNAVQLSQADRRYTWRARSSDMGRPGVRSFTRYSGNWHMIPASPEVAAQLKRVKVDDVVRIEGDLVQVTFSNGIYFRSSLVRDDLGDGACEIIRTRSVVIEA